MENRIGKKTNTNSELVDQFGRIHDYLRISITNSCNFSCSYCRPNASQCPSSHDQMAVNEIRTILGTFIQFGIKKIRLTGGEPLTHPNFEDIAMVFKDIPVEKALTTNALLLDKHFNTLISAGFKSINISLDTLKPASFKEITGSNDFHHVYSNLIRAMELGFRVKLNTVVIRGVNENELVDFVKLTKNHELCVRFIEFMPFANNKWETEKLVAHNDIIQIISAEIPLAPVQSNNPHQPAEYYKAENSLGEIGIISTVTKPFCADCNRIRITADGKIKNCLFGNKEIDLVHAIKTGKNLQKTIHESLLKKPAQHGGKSLIESKIKEFEYYRGMYAIGG